jgi:cytochrome c-type biogenesis protein CcmH/NrfG
MNIKRIAFISRFLLVTSFALPHALQAQTAKSERPEVIAARQARDSASLEELRKIIAQAQKEATETNNLDAYLRLALFQSWLCEAAESHKDKTLIKKAATDGIAAAEKAIALNPKSSEAHWLAGDLRGRLIPHVFGGGMRYGKRAADEMDKALELDPKNADACVSRAISYFYTPEAFGGSRDKAFELLRKAVELDSQADTPHVWLALFFLETHKTKEALVEILSARQINSNRAFTNSVYEQVTRANKA